MGKTEAERVEAFFRALRELRKDLEGVVEFKPVPKGPTWPVPRRMLQALKASRRKN